MELPSQNKIRTLGEKGTYNYLGILEADTIKQVEMKDKIKEKYLRRTRKLFKVKLSHKNLVKGINNWAVLLVRYSGTFVKWTREERIQMDRKTRNPMTMHKVLHPRYDVVSRKEGGRGLACVEDSVDTLIQRLEDYIEKHEGGLITAIKNDTGNTMTNRIPIGRKQKWEEKQLYWCFKRLINSISYEHNWT